MKIAVLGWGSLIWDNRSLKIVNSKWNSDGPFLPIEFARLSGRGTDKERITLVIDENSEKVQTLWNIMGVNNLEEAKKNLQDREGMNDTRNIGYFHNEINKSEFSEEMLKELKKWCKKKQFDAVIWTGLKSNLEDMGDMHIKNSIDGVLWCLKNKCPNKKFAMEYIKKTPSQIKTKYREIIEDQLGWVPDLSTDEFINYV